MADERFPGGGPADAKTEVAFYRSLFRDVPFGWAYHQVVLDDQGRPVDYVFLKANRKFEEFTGLRRADIIGNRVTEIIPGIQDADPDLITAYGEVALGAEPLQFELYFAPFDRWYNVVANSPERGYFNAIFEEISDRKKAEQDLARAMEELARSNKDLEQFAYVASHDLQEPLRMVSSYTDLLARRYTDKLDERANSFINFAVDGARRMQDLINDLLSFSRVGSQGTPAVAVDLNEVTSQVIADLALTIEETGGEVLARDLPEVLMDPVHARQLLQNLVGNALKFHGEAPPRIEVSAAREGDMWALSVRDNGIGIPEKHRERVFGIFQRLHRRRDYAGTGIGLAMVRRIMENAGGEVRMESAEGGGTTFTCTLPAASEEGS